MALKLVYLFLGMALQGLISGAMATTGLITLTSGQQIGSGSLFILISLLLMTIDKPQEAKSDSE